MRLSAGPTAVLDERRLGCIKDLCPVVALRGNSEVVEEQTQHGLNAHPAAGRVDTSADVSRHGGVQVRELDASSGVPVPGTNSEPSSARLKR